MKKNNNILITFVLGKDGGGTKGRDGGGTKGRDKVHGVFRLCNHLYHGWVRHVLDWS